MQKNNFFKWAIRHWKFILGTAVMGLGASMAASGEYQTGLKDGYESTCAVTRGYLEGTELTDEQRAENARKAGDNWWKKTYK